MSIGTQGPPIYDELVFVDSCETSFNNGKYPLDSALYIIVDHFDLFTYKAGERYLKMLKVVLLFAFGSLFGLWAQADELSSVKILAFDSVVLDSSGVSDSLSFEVPKAAMSFQIVAIGSADEFYVIDSLIGPGSEVFVSENPPQVSITREQRADNPFIGPLLSRNRSAPSPFSGYAGLLFPNNPGVDIKPGKYAFKVKAVSDHHAFAPIKAYLLIKLLSPSNSELKGELHTCLHFTGSRKLTAESALKDAFFKKSWATTTKIMATANISVIIDSIDNTPPGFEDVTEHLREILKAVRASSSCVNLFFADADLRPVAALSSGLPGPSAIPDPHGSGVVIFTNSVLDDQDLGATIAHETGHYLGLFHTAEMNAEPSGDQMTDTQDMGALNIMWPDTTPDFAKFSKQQKSVLLGNPLIHLIR